MPILAGRDNWIQRIRPAGGSTGGAAGGCRLRPRGAPTFATLTPTRLTHPDGRIQSFARGEDDAVWNRCRPPPPANAWSAWQSLGGAMASEPAAVMTQEGGTHVFARGRDDALWHLWRAPGLDTWSSWTSLGGLVLAAPVALVNHDGFVEVFAGGNGTPVVSIRQTGPGPTDWSAWNSLDHSLWEY